MCVSIAKVTTNLDNYIASQALPYNCDLNKVYSTPQGCTYQYKTAAGTFSPLVQDYCQCAMDNSNNSYYQTNNYGICPLPSQDQLQTYVNALKFSLQNSSCHNMDQMNWPAQLECGIGAYNVTLW